MVIYVKNNVTRKNNAKPISIKYRYDKPIKEYAQPKKITIDRKNKNQ